MSKIFDPFLLLMISGGKHKPTGIIDVAMIQSLMKKNIVDDRVANYGQLIVDECHHISAVSFEAVTRAAPAKYVLGLTATATRKDGHHPIISSAILKNNMKRKDFKKDVFLTKLRMPYENIFSKTDKKVRYRRQSKAQFQGFMQALAFNFKRLIAINAPPLFA